MPSTEIQIKPNNHTAVLCETARKLELTKLLISQNSSLNIVVTTALHVEDLKEDLKESNVKVFQDREFISNKELECEMLISYDMPNKAIIYMARVAKATQKAYLLLNSSEQKIVHSIETLLGRAIKQEKISGFEEEVEEVEVKEKPRTISKAKIKEIAKQRYDEKTGEPKAKKEYSSDKKYEKKQDDGRWDKKKKAPNKFLGKDESGKAKFSGKSGDRNHRYDGTPKDGHRQPRTTGRKVDITGMKSKKSKDEE